MKCSECSLCLPDKDFFYCAKWEKEVFRPKNAGCDEGVEKIEKHGIIKTQFFSQKREEVAMLRYCIKCQKIFGCVERMTGKKECYNCQGSENCPLDILYPKQDVTGGLCHQCSKEIIWKAHEKRHAKAA